MRADDRMRRRRVHLVAVVHASVPASTAIDVLRFVPRGEPRQYLLHRRREPEITSLTAPFCTVSCVHRVALLDRIRTQPIKRSTSRGPGIIGSAPSLALDQGPVKMPIDRDPERCLPAYLTCDVEECWSRRCRRLS
jgi:hypothetical protein